MKKTLKLILFLGIVSALSGLVIGYVNNITSPLIEEAQRKQEQASLELLYPGSSFEKIGDEYVDDETILAIYEAIDQGYVFKLNGKGYSSNGITVLAGFDYEGNIYKVVSLSQQETSGFGSKVFEDLDGLYAGTKADEDIDMLSGATITSTAMKNMLNKARSVLKEIR